MWEWWCWTNEKEKRQNHHHNNNHQQALLILRNDDDEDRDHDHDHDPTATIASAAMDLTSWLSRRRRRRRYLLLAICSPLLLPCLCATFPLLCAAEFCIRVCRRQRRRRRRIRKSSALPDDHGGDGLSRCEEGRGENDRDEVRLLQRYLEDQLLLVGSVYDCGDCDGDDGIGDLFEDCDGVGVEFFDTRGPPLP